MNMLLARRREQKPVNTRIITLMVTLGTSAVNAAEIPVVWSSYFGGQGHDEAIAVSVDADGSIWVAGTTNQAASLPHGERFVFGSPGGWDAVVLKLSPDGSRLLWKAVLGGPGLDVVFDMDVNDGIVTLCGRASAGFPTTVGPAHGGTEDAFIVQLDPSRVDSDRSPLIYGRFLGGCCEDVAVGVSVDGAGAVRLAGYTASPGFPVTPGGLFDTYQGGAFDLFIAKIDPSTDTILYSTFLGSPGDDLRTAADTGPSPETARYAQIRMADAGDAVVLCTHSMSPGLPTTDNAYQRVHNGNDASDIYIAQVLPDLDADPDEQLIYGTYLGSSGWDAPEGGIAVDEDGVFYVLAYSWSPGFPMTFPSFDSTHQGKREGTLSVIDPEISENGGLIYSTFLGGSGAEYNGALVLLPEKRVFVAGYTDSRDFPVSQGAYEGGPADAPVLLFDLNPDSPEFGTALGSRYYGGTGDEDLRALARTEDGGVVAVGYSSSPGLGTTGAIQVERAGGADMLITKFGLEETPKPTVFRRGDSNDDGNIDIADPVFVLNWLFGGGSAPGCLAAADTNGEGDAINISDPTYLLNHLFAGGPAPVAPYPDCGPLPADEALGCETPPARCP